MSGSAFPRFSWWIAPFSFVLDQVDATQMSKHKMIYYFGKTKTDGTGVSKQILGGKGANLAEMTSIGLPVPPGFTITTECCDAYYKSGSQMPPGLMEEVRVNVAILEQELGKVWRRSVPTAGVGTFRAAVSMPGMMNTILNLRLNDVSTAGLAKATSNERFAYDAYRRLISMFGDVVMGIEHHLFEEAFDAIKKKYGVQEDTDVSAAGLKELCQAYKAAIRRERARIFLRSAQAVGKSIEAVFKSWRPTRPSSIVKSRTSRPVEPPSIASRWSTATWEMIPGPGSPSRNPNTGENKFFGEFLVNAQGEDVVAGIRTPSPPRRCQVECRGLRTVDEIRIS